MQELCGQHEKVKLPAGGSRQHLVTRENRSVFDSPETMIRNVCITVFCITCFIPRLKFTCSFFKMMLLTCEIICNLTSFFHSETGGGKHGHAGADEKPL